MGTAGKAKGEGLVKRVNAATLLVRESTKHTMIYKITSDEGSARDRMR
jgi:hypothetical protein